MEILSLGRLNSQKMYQKSDSEPIFWLKNRIQTAKEVTEQLWK